MFKRTLILLLTLLLCGITVGAEQAYDKVGNALYRIVLRTEEGDTTLGSGVLLMDPSVLLTAESCCREGQLYAIGYGGEYAVKGWDKAEGSGVVLMELSGPTSAEPLALAGMDTQSLPFVFGVNSEGMVGSMPLYRVRQTWHQGRDALLLTAEEGLLPGGFMTDAQGNLVGMVIAQQMEGVGSYVALDANELASALVKENAPAGSVLGCTLSWKDGILTVRWEDQGKDSTGYVITLCGENNLYYSSFDAEKNQRSFDLVLPPGHTYEVQVQKQTGDAKVSPVWDDMKRVTIPAVPFSQYGYTQTSSLCSVPAGKKAAADTAPMPLISVDTLTDQAADIYLQVQSSYDIADRMTLPMTLEIIAPDGQFFYEELRYTLTPDNMTQDSFVLQMDDLLSSCAEFSRGKLSQGDYVIRYSLNGKVAGEYPFTAAPAGTPVPTAAPASVPAPAPTAEAPATNGFASGLKVHIENGLMTLSWDAASVPEGAKVSVFYLYEGNTYYTYHALQEAVSETTIFTVPERRIMAWVSWSTEGEPSPGNPGDNECVIVPAAQAEAFRDNSFQNLQIGLMPSADPNAGAKGVFIPQQPLTREMLSDRSTPLYFQTEDCYRISATTEDHPLAIVLITPEGMLFIDQGSYIFDLTLQTSDLWLKDVSKLFADYESLVHGEKWPGGEYRILYLIDGKVAGEFDFTLE